MTPTTKVHHIDVSRLLARIKDERFGFLIGTDIATLARHPDSRLTQVLVRAGRCRFVCAVQDVSHLERCLTTGGDYVRDVSLAYTWR